jgi:prepilin-type N-terminal cleavage/methylation domain-containing protein
MKRRGSQKGFSLIELLLSLALVSLIAVGTAYFLKGQQGSFKGQKERLAMQENARAALEFVTTYLKGTVPSSVASSTPSGAACNNAITFVLREDFGKVTSGGSNTITDTSKNWTVNQWQNSKVRITGGTGNNQELTISVNTATQLTTSTNWTTNPNTTSTYEIRSENEFLRSGNNLQFRRNAVSPATLAENVTCFTVTRYPTGTTPPDKFDVTITMTTPTTQPDTGQTATISLQSVVNLRN